MSALWAGLTGSPAHDPGGRQRSESTARKLRPVVAATPRLSRRPFAIVLILLFGLGMTGLLMLNTTLQNQAFQARTLNRQATQLAHVQVDLESQLDAMAAAPELARRASDLGMRANPKPAFLVVPSGKVIGKRYRVRGNEMPGLVVKSERELNADDAKTAAKRARKAADRRADTRARALQADRRAIDKAVAEAQAKLQAAKAAAEPKSGAKSERKSTSDSGGNR